MDIAMIDWAKFWVMQSLFWGSGAVFAYSLEKREKFRARVVWFAGFILVFSFFFLISLWDGREETLYVYRVVSEALMIIFLYSGWKTTFSTAVYNSIWAITLWQLLLEVWSVIEFLGAEYFRKNPPMIIVGILMLFGVNYTIVAKTIGKWMPLDRRESIGPRQLMSAILIFAIIEVLAFSEELRHISEYSSEWKFLYISQLLCIVILYLQSELFKKSAMREELALMNLLWKNKQEQYELAKENINLINQKSHDLKHQIRALRRLNKEEFDRYLNEMEDSVQIYESIVKTGNDVFDTILTEKSLYCQKHEIKVTCVADGGQLDFIETIDLYAILGNALDNAIEAVEKFGDLEKRQIDVLIHRQQNFLVMHFINPVQNKLVFEDDLPVTTKGDKAFHGFGLRSIAHFVKKYEGHMTVSEEEGCFSLKILIPIPENKEKTTT